MNAAQKILIIIGAFFAAIGGTIALIMGSMARLTGMPFIDVGERFSRGQPP